MKPSCPYFRIFVRNTARKLLCWPRRNEPSKQLLLHLNKDFFFNILNRFDVQIPFSSNICIFIIWYIIMTHNYNFNIDKNEIFPLFLLWFPNNLISIFQEMLNLHSDNLCNKQMFILYIPKFQINIFVLNIIMIKIKIYLNSNL